MLVLMCSIVCVRILAAEQTPPSQEYRVETRYDTFDDVTTVHCCTRNGRTALEIGRDVSMFFTVVLDGERLDGAVPEVFVSFGRSGDRQTRLAWELKTYDAVLTIDGDRKIHLGTFGPYDQLNTRISATTYRALALAHSIDGTLTFSRDEEPRLMFRLKKQQRESLHLLLQFLD